MFANTFQIFISLTALLSVALTEVASSSPQSVSAARGESDHSQLWTNLHRSDVSRVKVAIFAVGSIENHGPHLPFGTDLLLAEAIVRSAVSGIHDVSILPTSPFGASFEHENLEGTIAVHDSTLNALWDDVLTGIVNSGVTKIVLVNAHGGQTQNVEIAIRRARFMHKAMVVSFNAQAMLAKAWMKVETRAEELATESLYGIHGGLIETSVMMYLFPTLVKNGQRQHFIPRRTYNGPLEPHGDVVSFGWRSEDLSMFGALGNAKTANADIGALIFNETVVVLNRLVQELLQTEVAEIIHLPTMQASNEAKLHDQCLCTDTT